MSNFIFAGSVTARDNWNSDSLIEEMPREWQKQITTVNKNVIFYLSGTTDILSSTELLNYIKGIVWELVSYDISHTGDMGDRVEIINTLRSGDYSYVVFHGKDFEDIVWEYSSIENVASIRTAEISKNFDTPVIKVDFLW